ncbi:hypothetical protein ABIF73_007582 [Bradyrhizobium japonicum]|uniref:hypothetical protein n=2 Tax=Bradyrhizobium japonicum TaxID=375 RepID=UPI00216742AC|nr:hypothetical protein [Bradyrhizobium japonicum]
MLHRAGAMRMVGVVMRNWSNLYVTASVSGLMVTMLLLGAILARNVGPAEKKGGRVIAVSEHREARTQATSENGGGATVDFGVADLRGSLP